MPQKTDKNLEEGTVNENDNAPAGLVYPDKEGEVKSRVAPLNQAKLRKMPGKPEEKPRRKNPDNH